MSIRVLIADDQTLVRTGFRMILEAQDDLEVIGEAADGEQAVEEARRLGPDVILMDIRMPRMDGVEATRRLIRLGPNPGAHVLILTTFDLDEYVVEALMKLGLRDRVQAVVLAYESGLVQPGTAG